MAEKCCVKGKLTTDSNLSLAAAKLDWGKWSTAPITYVGAPKTGAQIFEALGRSDTATGCEGTVSYITDDGAKFELYFDCPYSKQNIATITGVSGPVQLYSYSVTYPKSGQNWDASYSISLKNPITAPVANISTMTTQQILDTITCGEYSMEMINRLASNSQVITLDMVLDNKLLGAESKVWLVVNGDFLSNGLKRLLSIKFAEYVLPQVNSHPALRNKLKKMLRKASEFNNGSTAARDYEAAYMDALASLENDYAESKHKAAIDTVLQTLCGNASSALRNAYTCSIASLGDKGVDGHLEIIRNLVSRL